MLMGIVTSFRLSGQRLISTSGAWVFGADGSGRGMSRPPRSPELVCVMCLHYGMADFGLEGQSGSRSGPSGALLPMRRAPRPPPARMFPAMGVGMCVARSTTAGIGVV